MKTYNIILLAILLPFCAFAQAPNFSLNGKIGTLDKPAMAYIDYMDNGVGHEDSVALVNGSFKFSGYVSGNAYARMALDHTGGGKGKAVYTGDVIYFYFGKEQVSITSKDSLQNAVFKGSKVYDESEAYNKEIGGTIMALTKAVNIDFNRGTEAQKKDTAYTKAVDQRFRKNIQDRNEKQFLFAKNHPNSYFALVALSEAAGSKVDVARVTPLFNALPKALRETDTGKELAQRIEANTTTALGKQAPLFTQNNAVGKPVSLADYKGKVVLVEFWASWCSPCRAENPNLVKQYQTYKDKGFEIISVSLDNVKERWLEAIEKDGLAWTHVSDLKGWNNEVGRLYGVRAVPASFLLDAQGKIIGNGLRGEPLNKKLAEVFNQPHLTN
ncbi:TlpA disulfide reductase family protein [Pedobacter sp. BMA]|uniref:TlpA disulfide reductase family protein n=1 Tax=Pedobacter sp. BMA TaxID=1663685 RepID=UPI00064A44FE|nr:TlpA disulfide reductase family protein [Pedobacter sp. BMA]KLT67221.1 thioredoxin [Pedobacter sp. BMA]